MACLKSAGREIRRLKSTCRFSESSNEVRKSPGICRQTSFIVSHLSDASSRLWSLMSSTVALIVANGLSVPLVLRSFVWALFHRHVDHFVCPRINNADVVVHDEVAVVHI